MLPYENGSMDVAVSYTHLDVDKRQDMQQVIKGFILLLAVTFDIRAKAKGKN